MAKRKKMPTDLNQRAKAIVDLGWHSHYGEHPNEFTIAIEEPDDPPPSESN